MARRPAAQAFTLHIGHTKGSQRIDLRGDTVARPIPAMLAAMMDAEVYPRILTLLRFAPRA